MAAGVTASTSSGCLLSFDPLLPFFAWGGIVDNGGLKLKTVLVVLPKNIVIYVVTSLVHLILISTMINERVAHPRHVTSNLVRLACWLETPLSRLLFPRIKLPYDIF